MSPSSLENIPERWWPEVKHFCPTIPIILVGNKIDLRDNQSAIEQLHKRETPITREQGLEMAERIKAIQYIECSARTSENLERVFTAAAEVALSKKRKGFLKGMIHLHN